jgi:hypothetical protein
MNKKTKLVGCKAVMFGSLVIGFIKCTSVRYWQWWAAWGSSERGGLRSQSECEQQVLKSYLLYEKRHAERAQELRDELEEDLQNLEVD